MPRARQVRRESACAAPTELFARLLKALLESKEKTLREELNAQNKRVLERELEEMQKKIQRDTENKFSFFSNDF